MPNKEIIDNTSSLFREVESSFGTRDFCYLALDSFSKSINTFVGTTDEFYEQIKQLLFIVKNTSPRISLLIFMFFQIFEEFTKARQFESYLEDQKKILSDIIDKVRYERQRSMRKLISASKGIIENGDVVLLHVMSHTVFDIIKQAKINKIKFRVILSEQEPKKTASIIRFLIKKKINFQVIPEYLLAHIENEITKVIVGGVTLNSSFDIISDAGSQSLISEMHYHEIPIFVAMTTDKFSLWKAEHKHHRYKSSTHKLSHGVEYDKLVFSHDRYPISMVTKFITNKGVMTPEEVKNIYNKLFKERKKWRQMHGI